MEGPWWRSMFPPRGGAWWDHKDGLCLLHLCAPPPGTSRSHALCRAPGCKNAYSVSLVDSQGAARKGEGPVTRQVQLYRVNTRIRRSSGSWGSQSFWLLGWEGKASEEITGQTRHEGHPRQRDEGTHQYLQLMVWNVGGQAGCTRTAPLLWRLCWTSDACQRNWRPGEIWSQEVTWRHAVMSNIVAIHHRRLFKLIKIK